jgi:transcriptional regulator with XRE-family HTH domain
VAETESFERARSRVNAALGRNVKRLRHSLQMSQADLADDAGIRRAVVIHIERGMANPTLDTIVRIATALGVESADLFKANR